MNEIGRDIQDWWQILKHQFDLKYILTNQSKFIIVEIKLSTFPRTNEKQQRIIPFKELKPTSMKLLGGGWNILKPTSVQLFPKRVFLCNLFFHSGEIAVLWGSKWKKFLVHRKYYRRHYHCHSHHPRPIIQKSCLFLEKYLKLKLALIILSSQDRQSAIEHLQWPLPSPARFPILAFALD